MRVVPRDANAWQYDALVGQAGKLGPVAGAEAQEQEPVPGSIGW